MYFISISVKCIFLQIFNDIKEDYILYRNKDDIRKKQVTKVSYLLIQKILYFIRISVKCILRQIFIEIEEYQVYIGTKTTYEIFLKQKFLCFDFKDFFVL